MGYYKWKPSKSAIAEYTKSMNELEDFLCTHLDISASAKRDSFYFTHNNVKYRISNHSVEKSNEKAFNFQGEQVRELYHPNGREEDTRYIHASKTRLIEIYNNIKAGRLVDGRGYLA